MSMKDACVRDCNCDYDNDKTELGWKDWDQDSYFDNSQHYWLLDVEMPYSIERAVDQQHFQ